MRCVVTVSTRVAVVLADVLVLLVTWSKTAHLYKEARRLDVKAPLATLLFRDGTLQFLILLILNIITPLAVSIPSLSGLNFATPFLTTLQPLLICRFILSLRQVKPAGSSWVTGSQSASLRFAGDMGQLLGVSGDQDNEDEDKLSALTRELNTLNPFPEAEAPTEPSQSSVAPEAYVDNPVVLLG
ncbi:hypothetical protein BC629DRAFT_1103434 [Irpex lacteus]|nr:hypothetical protein BC629DRAFT_1103434 [Irpex lacteus]